MRETLVKTAEFKDSPLGKIPEDLDVVTFEDVSTVRQGLQIAISRRFKDYKPGRYIYITVEYLNNIANSHLLEFIESPGNRVICHQDDVLVTRTGATGKIITDVEGVFHNNFFLVDYDRSKVNRDYLVCYLNLEEIQKEIKLRAGTTTIPDLKHRDFYSLTFLRPSLAEQEKIAVILKSCDETIAHTSSLIAKLKQMKAGLLHDLLTRGLDENGELRDAIGHPEQFKDSPLGQIPKDWEAGKIGSHCEIHNHLRKPISAEERDLIRGHYPYYGPTGILDYINEYRVDGEYVLIGEDGDHFLKFTTQPMTLLVSGEFNVNNHAHILKGTERCHTEWIDLFFRHRDITLSLTRQGAGRFKLNKASLENLSLAVPPPDEQIAINKILETHENRIRAEEAYRDKLKLQKKGLMHDLLTGKVRVKDADKFTPASDTV